MADEDIGVDIEFDLKDKAGPKISRLEKMVESLEKRVSAASSKFTALGATLGGVVGVFGLHASLHAAKEYIDHVDRISNLTGIAGDHVAGMSEALQIAGVEAGEVEGLMMRMTKRGALAEEQNKAMATMAARYGVNLKEGPQKVLVKISELVEKNKIGAGQVGRILGVQGATLANMMDAMTKGPAELNRMIDEATDKNAFMGGAALDIMQSYDESVNRVGLAWKRMTASIIVKMAPSLEKLASKFEDHIEGWSEKAGKFATYLVDHMEQIIALAKAYSKIMFANFALQKLTGQGLIGNVGKLGKFVASGPGLGKLGGGGLGMIGTFIGAFRSVFSGATKLGPLMGVLGRLSVVGLVIGALVGAFKYIGEAASALKERFGGIFSRIWENLKRIGGQFAELFGEDAPLGKGIRWLGEKFLDLIGGILKAVEWATSELSIRFEQIKGWKTREDVLNTRSRESLTKLFEPLKANKANFDALMAGRPLTQQSHDQAMAIIDAYQKGVISHPGFKGYVGMGMNDESMAALKRRYGKFSGGGSGGTPEVGVYQDFRGSRFDIKQQFAEGFDPDRIAVGFANDVASIGERKLQSGFAPLFTVR